ncbi:MAG: LUD domain-containing protein [Opitutales bacterium]|nr:LUD domain-containing protein [Opitutales bacterium]
MDQQCFLDNIRAAVARNAKPSPTPLPEWDPAMVTSQLAPDTDSDSASLWETFCQRFRAVNGQTIEGIGPLIALLLNADAKHGYLAPELNGPLAGPLQNAGITLESAIDTTRIDDYAFGITRAAGIIAETGSVVINESSTPSRLGALAPWIHVTLIDANTKVFATLVDAIKDLGDEPYVVFATGPSKTADVEGILIEGVHGPGMQICLRL